MNPLFLIDFYKVGHVSQYPKGTTHIWSNFTPRYTHVKGRKDVVFFGLQYFIKEVLQKQWKEQFFDRPLQEIIAEYRELIQKTLGVQDPYVEHIVKLWFLGYLPLEIYSLPEGVSVPLNVPMLVITNTHPDFFWLPNYFETILSNILWKPCTSATTAQSYRRLFKQYAQIAGEKDFSFIDWQGHDFSYRGMSGREDAILSGMGHLLSFSGTDTVPAIVAARDYYNADLSVGGSVPATEHSVMCAGSEEGEFETFRRLIEDIYPTGIVSIVSDTWDLWKVLTDFVPRLKDSILARNGKVVIRPDSGDPVNILCGADQLYMLDPEGLQNRKTPAQLGTLRLLAEAVGTSVDGHGLPKINKMGAIYGDSITLERADRILNRTVNELRLSPYNVVFGIGSYTYEYVTRDTFGFAMKATAIRKDGEVLPIFKKPKTDGGGKNSHKGIPLVYEDELSTNDRPVYVVVDGCTNPTMLMNCAFRRTYANGRLLIEDSFETIRKRVRA